jgi:hypothetical protein
LITLNKSGGCGTVQLIRSRSAQSKVERYRSDTESRSLAWSGLDREATDDRLDQADGVNSEIMAAADKGFREEVLEDARCVALAPHLAPLLAESAQGDAKGFGIVIGDQSLNLAVGTLPNRNGVCE